MKKITIVTGNPGKVRELRAMSIGKIDFKMRELELDEIQSLDLKKIVQNKVQQAYSILQKPVIVDDVSAGLDSLKGLPGPFIRFFNSQLGSDSLLQLTKSENESVSIDCIAAYYDGTVLLLGEGSIKGKIVKPRGKNGFGFDSVVVPKGQTLTMAEMTEEQKMQISHRGIAFRHLLEKLYKLG